MTTMTSDTRLSAGKFTGPALGLRLEALTVLLGAIALYAYLGGDWLAFLLLLLVPDLGMLGYLVNPRVGSVLYNLVHLYTLPAALAALSLAAGFAPGLPLALIWAAHIALDRLLGYGLKYPTGFKDTHLERL